MNRLFNKEEKQFIIDNVVGKSLKELTNIFNKKFNRNISEYQINTFKKHNKLRNNIYSRPKLLFNEEEKSFIINNIEGLPNNEFLEIFNKKFNRDITLKQLSTFKSHHKITSGLGSGFYKGHKPKNYKKIGVETIRNGDRTFIKTGNPSVYEEKHRYLYQKYKGKIPKDYVVIFADGDKNNFNLDNLILMSKAEHFVSNTHGLLFNNRELTKTGLVLAKEMLKRRSFHWNLLKETNYSQYLIEKQKLIDKKIKYTEKRRKERIGAI